jgi:hypothetical protein
VTANEETERRLQFLHLFATAFTRDESELSEFAFQSVLRRTLKQADSYSVVQHVLHFFPTSIRYLQMILKTSMEGTDHGFFSDNFLILIDVLYQKKKNPVTTAGIRAGS